MNPYLIQGPALISFSGGRTSAFMLREILAAHGGTLPDDVLVGFANTGKEREEALRFVHECGSRWGVKVHWLEWRRGKPGFEEVGFNSAARAGEPFKDMIAWKKMPPNWRARFCTEFLKVRTLHGFAASLNFTAYKEVIGLRADEGARLLKMYARNDTDHRSCVAPLDKAGVSKSAVMTFWLGPSARFPSPDQPQGFDLGLADHEGNCDLCFLKSKASRKAIIRDAPARADWWIGAEEGVNGFFDRRNRYRDLQAEVLAQPAFAFDPAAEDYDAECGLTCAA